MNSISKFAIASALWMLNPIIGCTPEPEFTFGEPEMEELMNSVSTDSWMTERNAVQYEIRFDLSKGNINYDPVSEDYGQEQSFGSLLSPVLQVGAARACGTRSFLSEADACLDSTILSVEGSVEIIDIASEQVVLAEAVNGAITVWGKELNEAEFWLSGAQSGFDLYSSDGISFELTEASW